MILALQSFCENSHHDDSREMDEETVEDLDWVSLCDHGSRPLPCEDRVSLFSLFCGDGCEEDYKRWQFKGNENRADLRTM